MRTPEPYADPPGPPRGGWLYSVAYTNSGGARCSVLFRTRATADRHANMIMDQGGSPVRSNTSSGHESPYRRTTVASPNRGPSPESGDVWRAASLPL